MRLVFIGEVMVELAPDGAGYRKGYAGDTFNMAWYARQLAPADWVVDYMTAVGTDAISDEVLGAIAAAGVGIQHIQRHPTRTVGLYMISLKNGERSFSYWRGQSAARQLAENPALLGNALQGADIVCLSGITIAVLEGAGRTNLAAALGRYRASGGRVAFDPNIRPRLWADAEEMRRVIMDFAALADIVLASFEDETTHFGDPDPSATIARYRAVGCEQIIVKDGGNPILAVTGDECVQHRPDPVDQIVDSTAAGDSFNAAFLVSTLSGATLRTSLQNGAALSRDVIQHVGALAPAAVTDFKRATSQGAR